MNPTSPEPGRRALFLELVVVLLVAWVPAFLSSFYQRSNPVPRTLDVEFIGLAIQTGYIALILFLPWRAGESLRHLGIRKVRWWSEPLWGALIVGCCWMMYSLLYHLMRDVRTTDDTVNVTFAVTSTLHRVLMPFFILMSALFEELLFRGYLWDRLRRLTGRTSVAFWISTLLFTAYHPYEPVSLVYVLGAGVIFGLFRLKACSLPRLVLGHALFNLSIFYGR